MFSMPFNRVIEACVMYELHSPAGFVHTIPERDFKKMFRVSRMTFFKIVEEIRPYYKSSSRSGIPLEKKVLATLRFFAGGANLDDIGANKYIDLHKSSVSRCIQEVAELLGSGELLRKWIFLPRSLEEYKMARENFRRKFGIPGAVGVIDCTHVRIVAPPKSDPERPEHIYVNRKGVHTINVQVIRDYKGRVININARFPGCTHDAYIWANSGAAEILRAFAAEHLDEAFFVLGDRGYPLERCLMTLFPRPANEAEVHYNRLFARARNMIECTKGSFKNRFRALLRHTVLHFRPHKAGAIINACAVVHNIILDGRRSCVPPVLQPVPLHVIPVNSDKEDAKSVRRQIVDKLRTVNL